MKIKVKYLFSALAEVITNVESFPEFGQIIPLYGQNDPGTI